MNEPLTKPTRINRRRKKRRKITNLLKSGLTDCYRVANLFLLSQKTKVGTFSIPRKGQDIRPLNKVVFLCPPKRQAALYRVLSVMAGCIGRPLKRSAGSFAGVENPIQSATQYISILRGGYSIFKGAAA